MEKNISYEHSLRLLELPTLHRRIRGDMIRLRCTNVLRKNFPNFNLKINFHSTLASAYDTKGIISTYIYLLQI